MGKMYCDSSEKEKISLSVITVEGKGEEYMAFIREGDSFIDNSLLEMCECAASNHLDMYRGGIDYVNPLSWKRMETDAYENIKKVLFDVPICFSLYPASLCELGATIEGCIFRKGFLIENNLAIDPLNPFSDMLLYLTALIKAKRIMISTKKVVRCTYRSPQEKNTDEIKEMIISLFHVYERVMIVSGSCTEEQRALLLNVVLKRIFILLSFVTGSNKKYIVNKIKLFFKEVDFDFIFSNVRKIDWKDDYEEIVFGKRETTKQDNMMTEWDTLYLSCMANEIRDIHRDTFNEYFGRYEGMDVAVVGTGPSLHDYDPIENVIHIGVNGAYKKENLKLDYLFFQDFQDMGKGRVYDLKEIKNLDCKKFVGKYVKSKPAAMKAPVNIENQLDAKPYYTMDYYGKGSGYGLDMQIPIDIRFFPLIDNASTIFSAMHFALFTHPKKIYIVGCDCAEMGKHFYKIDSLHTYPAEVLLQNWRLIKKFVDNNYPEVEIISINPVGLKGVFSDYYQKGENNG